MDLSDPRTTADLVAGLVVLLGLVGMVVPVLPGTLLVAVAIAGWAAYVGEPRGWALAGAALVVLAAGAGLKYLLAGRHLRGHGVPSSTLVVGGLLGIVGFFVVPVIGLPLGFVVGVYLSELNRVGSQQAWPATVAALKAVGIALLVELAAGFAAAALWLTGALIT
ncbi:DUF456 domain-containing protein [Nocardioides marmoribigeumensis]|uniref:Uncharacterized protein YqgC (DUF456 family) n=1 Tax=Nocardioides marmoribigeumensis TaxID=433649 RepID=A0ABU2BRA7_9ACTN|nr:DUF456 domain-containing protein [Nocardioides marmoribigeumensis]MDR7361187.1 uncharacterized protein YqgC (DUF456 family) [Nocardioides marmoribigeumensis]